MTVTSKSSPPDFISAYRGQFTGILQWDQLDQLWATLKRSPDDWYVYTVDDSVPEIPASRRELARFVDEIDALLHREHEEDYCGIVYVDDKTHPRLVKIYDPKNLGVVCGFSDNPPSPGWILSTVKPRALQEMQPAPGNRKRWWRGIWNR
jgi:hypothetical protein